MRDSCDQPLTPLLEKILVCAVFEPGEWTATSFSEEFGEKLSHVQASARHAQLRGMVHYTGWKVRRRGHWDAARLLVSGPKVGQRSPGTEAVGHLLNWLQQPEGYAPTARGVQVWLVEQGYTDESSHMGTRLMSRLLTEGFLWPPRAWVATSLGSRALLFHRPDLRSKVDGSREHIAPPDNQRPKKGQIWKHFKGGEYEVLGFCRLQTHGPDDGLEGVLYVGSDGQVWARPLIDFISRFSQVV